MNKNADINGLYLQFKALIKQIEGIRLEHKSKDFLLKNPEIAKSISSFINKDGGTILIGVKDNEPDGYIFNQKDEEKIAQICKDRLEPPQSIDFEICELDKGTIIILTLLPSREPVKANGKYFYIRHQSTTRHMTQEELKRKFENINKLSKSIGDKEANEIINQRQIYRDIILDKNQKFKNYLTLDSLSGPILGSDCNIYTELYESFDKDSKLIFTTLHHVTIEELTKILAQYYKIFGNYSYSNSAFSIVQSSFNWVGFGPRNFINAIEEQNERYKSIYKKYGEKTHIHHREAAFFIDEIKDGLFFISCEPNYMIHSKERTIDYFEVGFVLIEQPFSRIFNEFFENILIEPITVSSNKNEYVKTSYVKIDKNIPFQPQGFLQSPHTKNEDKHIWVSGAYGKTPINLSKMGLNNNIVAHLRHHNWLESKSSYYIDRIKY